MLLSLLPIYNQILVEVMGPTEPQVPRFHRPYPWQCLLSGLRHSVQASGGRICSGLCFRV